MILEYLFLDNTHKEELKKYKYEDTEINISFCEFSENDRLIMKVEAKKNNEEIAKHLSNINDYIMTNYSPTILSNESSAYFNKLLYPLVNKFERNLRKFLYIKSTFYTGEGLKKAIENLESKDFGEIYDLLFIDDDFCKKAKEIVNGQKKGGSGVYSKDEIIAKLSELEENTTWNKIIGNNSLKYIKENFLKLKNYRNDIMHAHNIDYDTFKKAIYAFNNANDKLYEEIQKLITYPVSKSESENLIDALNINSISTLMKENIIPFIDSDIWKQASENSSNFVDALNEQIEKWEYIKESLKKWDKIIKSSEPFDELKEKK